MTEVKKVLTEDQLRSLIKDNKEDVFFWSGFSREYQLPESIIEEFKDFVDWEYISTYQELSEEFMIKHLEEIVTELKWFKFGYVDNSNGIELLREGVSSTGLIDNKNISEEVRNNISNLIRMRNL